MSTILEALKKSEEERNRSNTPTLSDRPAPREKSRRLLVVLLVLVMLLVFAVGLLLSRWWADSDSEVYEAPLVISKDATTDLPDVDPASVESEEVVINVLSYSEAPAQRFVMINGKMYRENEFVRAGLKVEEIKPSSVILNLRGKRVTQTP